MLRSHLIKDISDIGLRFSKPHGQHLRSLNWDKVRLALIGNGLSQEGFPTAWRTVEQHATRWGHSKLQELVWVLDRVLMRARWRLMGYWWDSRLQIWTMSVVTSGSVFLSPEQALAVLSSPLPVLRCLPSWPEAPLHKSPSELMGCSDSAPTEGRKSNTYLLSYTFSDKYSCLSLRMMQEFPIYMQVLCVWVYVLGSHPWWRPVSWAGQHR